MLPPKPINLVLMKKLKCFYVYESFTTSRMACGRKKKKALTWYNLKRQRQDDRATMMVKLTSETVISERSQPAENEDLVPEFF